MNGISLVSLRTFFRWYFSQVPFVTADPADIDKHFYGFNYDEKIGGEKDNLITTIAGLSNKTHTGLQGQILHHQSAVSEPMQLDVMLVTKTATGSYEEQEAAFDACKSELMNLISWMWHKRRTGDVCDYPVIAFVDPDKISHNKITNAGGGFYGWKITLYLQEYISQTNEFDPVTAPPLWTFPNGSLFYFDSNTGKFTNLEQGEEGQILTSEGEGEIPVWKTPTGKRILLTDASFPDGEYQNALLIGLVPQIDFNLYTNEGTGALLQYGDGYSFNDSTGTIGAPGQKYLLEIY